MKYRGYAASEAGAAPEIRELELGEIQPGQIDIAVQNCGLCHSDISMWKNDWGMTAYPFVGGHEIVGEIINCGDGVKFEKGQKVGVGWNAGSCGNCLPCLRGDQNLCAEAQGTIVGRHGGFAEVVRSDALWAIPLPDDFNFTAAGPLFCGGITVFNPIIQNNISPTSRVGVIGIGGLGHMALQFLNKWGCEVTAFSTSPEKEEETRNYGAHHFVNSRDESALAKIEGSLDFILSTVNVELDWQTYIAALRPKGILHLVGAAPEVSSAVFPLLTGQKSIHASPTGSPAVMREMTEFTARHDIYPKVDEMPMSDISKAFDRLEEEQPAYRIVLKNDFS